MEKKEVLKKNIDRYMEIKGIRFYTDLLYMIGLKLGLKDGEEYSFPDREKNNFSKMLKGERPLKYDFIIPLEEIFGVSLAKLLNDDSYFASVDKKNIPFLKGFRYYAHVDDYDLYDELFQMATIDGEQIIRNSDEYNKCFMDYLIEYRAYNGLRYLVDKHAFHMVGMNENYYIDDQVLMVSALPVETAKFIIDSNDDITFNRVYDYFEPLIIYPYDDIKCLYREEKFIEAILNNDKIFNTLFSTKKFDFDHFNKGIQPEDGVTPELEFINPLINICLDFCLKNIDEYKEQAISILKHGIDYNSNAIKKLIYPHNEYYCDNGLLYLKHKCLISNLVCASEVEVADEEINSLINNLKYSVGDIK